jgi:uncharacterized protein
MNGTSEPTEKGWIITYTGKRFYPLSPNALDVDIIDIAHHLSNICRYTGAVRKFYSVAQHCVLGSHFCPDNPFHFLMHDSAEAYLLDLPRPVKHDPSFQEYRDAEKRLEWAILPLFGIHNASMPPDVAQTDHFMCVWEGNSLMPPDPESHWTKFKHEVVAWPQITPWSPEQAEEEFLRRFAQLYKK